MPRLGAYGKAYFLPTGSRVTWGTATDGIHSGVAPTGMTEATSFQDVDYDMGSSDGVDATTRGDGNETVIPSLPKYQVTVSLRYDAADVTYLAMLKAKLAGTPFAMAFLDQESTVAGAMGIWADWAVLGFKKGEKLKGVQTIEVTLQPSALSAVPPEVVKVATGA